MCLSIAMKCSCDDAYANIHNMHGALPEEAVMAVHCPTCRDSIEFDPDTMMEDNGWVIEYDMEIAREYLRRFGADPDKVTPQFIFDEGYSTWYGLTPTDIYDKQMEMNEIAGRTKGDKRQYFQEVKAWTIERTARLAQEGWRKAILAQ